ncbi:MAG TPA: hypothetical protein VLA99_01040 [Nitrospiraceae bacterium]|nr:hypothetical protein [Nitrospiraceae bacterium]
MNHSSKTQRKGRAWLFQAAAIMIGLAVLPGCAAQPPVKTTAVWEAGRNVVRLESDPESSSNSHPATLTSAEVGTLLRGVRAWERRNIVHRLYSGDAPRTRAFRDDEIALLAPALSKALAQAGPTERVYFHLSHATEAGEEETTTGWVAIREPILHLAVSEVHDRHGPMPDISKYDRQMPNVPEVSAAFDVIFEPEEYLKAVESKGRFWAPDQREELQIRYREALGSMPAHPGTQKNSAPNPSLP